jgi:tRNA(fMet)-specific endonuclease VapC
VNGNKIALDTNQAIAVLNATGDVAKKFQNYDEICLPVPVVGELRFGALNSQHVTENISRIEFLVSHCAVLDINIRTSEIYSRIRMELKKKGTPIPENDIWIAAVCLENHLPLATSDGHFTSVDNLQVVE